MDRFILIAVCARKRVTATERSEKVKKNLAIKIYTGGSLRFKPA
jgi:hypothetical protein